MTTKSDRRGGDSRRAPGAILNPVNDALAPFGGRLTSQPITPDLIRRALREVGR
jgi:hypothetical protein